MQHHIANGVSHFDICGPDGSALSGFYANVFGWTVEPKGPGYALVETPDESANGAIVEAEHAGITIGIVVPDLGLALTLAQAHGGDIVMPATDNGWVKKAVLADPAGNRLTIIQA
jgi:predicted enzyme related to lactoylglutathione lyase